MKPDKAKDRAEVNAVIECETAAYFAKDYAPWASFWVQTGQALFRRWFADVGMEIHDGWATISSLTLAAMQAFPVPMPDTVTRVWDRIVISGDLAWVTFDQ